MSALIGQHTMPGKLTTVGCWSGKNVRTVVATKYLFTLADHDLHISKRLQEKSETEKVMSSIEEANFQKIIS